VSTEETAPPSHISSEEGGQRGVSTEETPPSVSSEGGGWRGCHVSKGKHPLRLTFRVREGGGGCVDRGDTPSVSHFE